MTRLFITLEPQEGESYADILAVANRAEKLGFDGLYRSDHYSPVWDSGGPESTDAWASLAGIARETVRITIGTMVSPVTFRPVANLAKVVATVAEMAGTVEGRSRVHLGLGTGWLESEHLRHGFPFEDVPTRFRRLEEHLRVIRALWGEEEDGFDFEGEFEQIRAAVFAPKPQPRPRIIVGGSGRRTTPRLAATFADEMNTPFPTIDDLVELRRALDDAAQSAGQDQLPLTVTAACVVGSTEREFLLRAGRLHKLIGEGTLDSWLDERRATWLLGTSDQVTGRLIQFIEAGADGFSLQQLLSDDLDMLDVLREEVAPELPGWKGLA